MRAIQIALLSLVLSAVAGCGGGGGGGGSDGGTANPTPTANFAPTANILASGQVAPSASGADLTASVGGEVSLSGAPSADPDGDILAFSWELTEKPSASQLSISASNAAIITFTPDVLGSYKFVLRVTDTKGAYTEKTVTILGNNTAPTPLVLITATFSATPTISPTQTISIGAPVLLDASSSTDPEGNPVTTSWTLMEKPSNSAASLIINGQTARFNADVRGLYKVTVHAQDPYGAYNETTYVLDAENTPPNAVLVTTVSPSVRNSGQSSVQASVGYNVVLDGSTSNDVDGNTLTYTWELVSKPVASAAALGSTSGVTTQISPDVLGNYVVRLTATDTAGASATYTKTIAVNNTRPTADITTNATPNSLPSAPSIRVPLNTQLTLRGSGSTDADGQTLTYAWSIVSAPIGSTSVLASPSAVNTQFVPDRSGSYSIRLRVTDTAGAYSERLLAIDTGNYPPVAVLDKNYVSVISGAAISASAALSYDEDGNSLSYAWAIDSRPVSSAATIAVANSASLSFTPDLPGTYVASVTVSDGTSSNVAYVTIRALSTVSGSVALNFVPLDAKYSKGLDKLVIVASNPDTLKIVDPFTSVVKTVAMPFAEKSFGLSPDGKLAAVLHEGRVSLVDLTTAQIINTSFTGGSQTDVFVLNDGVAYLIGQTGGQWVTPAITILDTRTGTSLPALQYGSGVFYGTQKGVFADKKNKVLFMAYGLSPSDISYFDIDPAAHTVLGSGDSPYHGDYQLGSEFYLSENQSLLFTSAGNFFNTNSLTYAGSLGSGYFISMSQSTQADELLLLQTDSNTPGNYSSTYKRYHGALFQADADIPLPTVGGQQGYGIKLFHSSNSSHIVLLQTGSAVPLDSGIQYHVIYR